jgi:hypothetical protein
MVEPRGLIAAAANEDDARSSEAGSRPRDAEHLAIVIAIGDLDPVVPQPHAPDHRPAELIPVIVGRAVERDQWPQIVGIDRWQKLDYRPRRTVPRPALCSQLRRHHVLKGHC